MRRRSRNARRRVHPSLWVGLALLALGAASGCRRVESKALANRPPEVLVSQPVEGLVTNFEDFTGRIEAIHAVEVRARVTGYLEQVHFEDGTEVKQGDLLFEIDPRPYHAEKLRTESALAQAIAVQKRAEIEAQRATSLFNRNALSREEYELAVTSLAEARAGVAAAEAARERARLDLDFTRVRAPISGRIGRRLVDPGNLIRADETPLTTIVSLDPMYVYFDMDERTVLRLRRLVREGKIASREKSEVTFLAALADEDEFPHSGVINFSDNKVEPTTGTLQVRGTIANPEPRVLSPGMFVRIRLKVGESYRGIMIAEQAIGSDQGRKFVYVVKDDNTIEYRPVEVGPLNGGLRVIESGLKPGERFVISGLQRVRPGAEVLPRLVKSTDTLPGATGQGGVAGIQVSDASAGGGGPVRSGSE